MPTSFDRRIAAVACSALVALLAGCGAGPPPDRDAQSGTTVTQDGVAYSIQISRELDPLAPDDRALFGSRARGRRLEGRGTTLVGVFLQARADGPGRRHAVDAPELVDAFGTAFRPMRLPASDRFAYHGRWLEPGEQIPRPRTVAAESVEDAAAVVYRIPTEVFLTDRPFTIRFGSDDRAASVQLDL
jgi:hypothetical protein